MLSEDNASEKAVFDILQKSKAAEEDNDTTADLRDGSPTAQVELDVTSLFNATATESNRSGTNDPKR